MQIRPIEREVAATSAMLARAFDDDPIQRFLLPGPRRRAIVLRSGFRTWVADARRHGWVRIACSDETDDRVLGACLWMPPEAYPFSAVRNLRFLLGYAGVVLHPARVRAGLRVVSAVERVHPRERHWYLATLGVDPDVQGAGIGTALVGAGLCAAADDAGAACYLETSRPENVSWYRSHGFELRDVLEPVADGPRIWTMWRDPT